MSEGELPQVARAVATRTPLSARRRGRAAEVAFLWLCRLAVVAPLALLAWLLGGVLLDGLSRLDYSFITEPDSRRAAQAGI
ncbi:MAG: hypothetical protein R2939_21225, partial [Kofleriaceae bacterium]